MVLDKRALSTAKKHNFEHKKSDPKTKDIAIVIFTASSLKDLAKKAVDAGAKDYIVKPFESEDLLEKIGKALGRR